MTDIAKCHGDGCDIKEHCYRYTAPASEFQSYITPTEKGLNCKFFMLLVFDEVANFNWNDIKAKGLEAKRIIRKVYCT